MASQPQQVFSLSFRSHDATRTDDGYQFAIRSEATRFKPTRISLGSIELPLSQPTICAEWSEIGVMERVTITPRVRRFDVEATVHEAAGGVRVVEGRALLPLHLNRVASRTYDPLTRRLVVGLEEPHGLTPELVAYIATWQEVELVAAGVRGLSLTEAFRTGDAVVQDALTFAVFVLDLLHKKAAANLGFSASAASPHSTRLGGDPVPCAGVLLRANMF